MNKTMVIAGVVVLYNPDQTVVTNIKSYIDFLQVLYVIDNSEQPKLEIIDEICGLGEKVRYIAFGENKGIGCALNVGAARAIEFGADWLLTMDQDSRFEENAISKLVEYCNKVRDNKVIIIAPEPRDRGLTNKKQRENPFRHIVITSGSLLNLKLYQENGSFREDFFIDFIDTEYCLRAKRNGLKVVTLKGVLMDHKLGDPKRVLFFVPTNHPPIRRYYITRNRIEVWREYSSVDPENIRYDIWCSVKELAKIILSEDKKLEKIWMIIRGIIDSLRGRFGKLPGT